MEDKDQEPRRSVPTKATSERSVDQPAKLGLDPERQALRSRYFSNHTITAWLLDRIKGLDDSEEIHGALLDAVVESKNPRLASLAKELRAWVEYGDKLGTL